MTEHQPSVHCHDFAGQPVVVIDNAHPDPTSLLKTARGAGFARDPGNYYPGLRAPADEHYQAFLKHCIRQKAMGYLTKNNADIDLQACLFSLACTPETDLRPIQCIPHIDSPEPSQLAVVHYLCDKPFGGTSFYQHTTTALTAIDRDVMADFFAQVKREMVSAGQRALCYTNGSNEWFERIGQVPARFNRLVVYRGQCLHAGDLAPDRLSSDPTQGRMTVNSFMQMISR